MARTLGEIVRRGADNVIANWPLLLIRIAESVALIAMMIGIVALAVLPLAAAAFGGSLMEVIESVGRSGDLEAMLRGFAPLLILYIVLVVSIALLVAVLVHAFVQGGIVGCYLAAEQAAPAAGAGRAAFAVFTPELWWSEGKRHVWRFFWIYNAIWFGYSLAILLPLLPLAILVFVLPENPVAIVLFVVGLIAILLFAIGLAFIVFVWSQVVLIDAARRNLGAMEAIAVSGEAIRGRLLNVILVAGIFFVISMTVGGVVGGFSVAIDAAGMFPGMGVALIPLQIVISLLNSIVSTLFGCWLLAALVAALAAPPAEVRHDVVAAT